MTIPRRLSSCVAAFVLLIAALPEAGLAQPYDHLSCYPVRVKGNQWQVESGPAGETPTLIPTLAPFTIENGCRLIQSGKLRPSEVCLPSDPEPREAPVGADLSQVYACYAIRCRSDAGFPLAFTTQFGSGTRYVRREGGVRRFCVPTVVGSSPTATPAPTATPSSTATPPSPTPTSASTSTPSLTPAPTPTSTDAAPTSTPAQPTATPTGTTGQPTATPASTPAEPTPTPPAATPEPTPLACGVDSQCVFVSSASYNGSGVGGLSGANAKCQSLAQAANLPGTYNAWISTSTSSPSTAFPQPDTPYRRVDGVIVASSWTDLISGSLSAPINVTEQGTALTPSGSDVWTATDTQGVYKYPGCDAFGSTSFVGVVGSSSATNAGWTSAGNTANCFDPNRIYCFQVSALAPTPTPTPSPKPTPTPTPTPNPNPPLACINNSPKNGMVYCYPTSNVAFDLYSDLIAAAASAGGSGINDQTRLHVVAVGGNGGNGKSKDLCTAGTGGDGGFATTTTRVRDIARFMGTTVQWLAGDSGRHNDQGGTGGASSIIWIASDSSTAPNRDNVLVLAGGGGGGGFCTEASVGHDGGHGGYVNGLGSEDNGLYEDYLWTINTSMFVGSGEDGHGDGGHPGSQTVPGMAGADSDGGSGSDSDASDGYGGRGGRVNDVGPIDEQDGGFTEWRAGSVDGPTVIGRTGRGSDKYLTSGGGAGGGGFGGGGGGQSGETSGGGGGGAGSLVSASSVFDVAPLSKSSVSDQIVFVFVK